MKEDGAVVRARAVRELERSVTLSDFYHLRGQPHDPTGTIRGVQRDAGRRVDAGEREGTGEQDDRFLPRRVFLTQEVVRKFGPTPDCRKCRGAMAGDKAYQFVNHSEGCRRRMEALMKEDDAFRRHVENAERRQTERLAEIVERRAKAQEDQDKFHEDHMKRKKRRQEGHGASLDGSDVRANPGSDSSGITRDGEGRSANARCATATVVDNSNDDDMGIPLATGEELSTSSEHKMTGLQSKRQAESDLQEPARTRQRIALLGHSGDTEFDVSEIFSAPRVCPLAEQEGFLRGYSLDVMHTDKVTGKSWDLAGPREQNRLWTLLRRRSSKLQVVSLLPTTRSSLSKFSQCPAPTAENECDVALLQVATKACRIQQQMGYFFILELPTTCSRWGDAELGKLLKTDGVQVLEIDQCEYLSSPTRLLTNLSLAAVVFQRCCERGHRHAQLPCNGVAVLASNHHALSLAFLDALRVELSELQSLSSFEKGTHRDEDDLHEPEGECYTNHWDELTGCPLDPHLVMRGRERELKKLEEMAVYERVPRAVAMQDREGKFVRTR